MVRGETVSIECVPARRGVYICRSRSEDCQSNLSLAETLHLPPDQSFVPMNITSPPALRLPGITGRAAFPTSELYRFIWGSRFLSPDRDSGGLQCM